MTEVVKKVRKRKQLPLFWNEKTEGNKYFSIDICNNIYNTSAGELTISPYTDFIPLLHVLSNEQDIFVDYSRGDYAFKRLGISQELINKLKNKGALNQAISYLLTNRYCSVDDHDGIIESVKDCMNHYLHIDKSFSLINIRSWAGSGSACATRNFKSSRVCMLNMRSYSGIVGGLSLFTKNDQGYRPQILSVVLPEDYIYQKLHLLTHGTIDMEKVIILINRELDSPQFVNKPFRAFYKKYILPILNEYECNIWKVPSDFIEDNCFHKPIQINEKNIMKKKELIQNIIQKFKGQYKPGNKKVSVETELDLLLDNISVSTSTLDYAVTTQTVPF